jgi:hypothetical protein
MTAAQAKIGDISASLERQSQLDQVRQQNTIARGQQMQQLASIAGYAAGSYFNKDNQRPANTSNPEG